MQNKVSNHSIDTHIQKFLISSARKIFKGELTILYTLYKEYREWSALLENFIIPNYYTKMIEKYKSIVWLFQWFENFDLKL